jgi:hypothetical protein
MQEERIGMATRVVLIVANKTIGDETVHTRGKEPTVLGEISQNHEAQKVKKGLVTEGQSKQRERSLQDVKIQRVHTWRRGLVIS